MTSTNSHVRWLGTTSGDWSDPSNWSSGTTPTAADNVVINTSTFQTITHSTGQDTVNSIVVGFDSFHLTGGSLDIIKNGIFRDAFSQTGGTLIGAELNTRLASFTGGTLAGASTLTTQGPLTIGNYTFDGGTTWLDLGEATQTGAITLGGATGGATLDNLAGARLRLSPQGILAGSNASSIVNAGKLSTEAGTSTTVIAPDLTSTGTLEPSHSSTFVLDGASNQISGAVIGQGTLELGASSTTSFSEAQLQFYRLLLDGSATATVSADSQFSPYKLWLSGDSSISLSGVRTYNGYINATTKGTFSGGQTGLTLTALGSKFDPATGNLTIADTNLTNTGHVLFTNVDLLATSVSNFGTVFQRGPVGSSLPLSESKSAITNMHLWRIFGPQSLGTTANQIYEFDNTQHGLLSVRAQGGVASLGIENINNNGTIYVASGTLQIDPGTLFIDGPTGFIGGSALELTGNDTLVINTRDRVHIQDLELRDNSTLTAERSFTFNNTFDDESNGTTVLRLERHTVTLSGTAYFIGTNGSAIIGNVVNTLLGTLVTAGTTHLSNAVVETAVFQNQGTVEATGNLTIGASKTSGSVSNISVYDLQNDAGISLGASMTGNFVNSGLFEKTSGTGTSVISTPFLNTGTITVTSGTLEFTAGSLQNNGTINGIVTTDTQGDIFITYT